MFLYIVCVVGIFLKIYCALWKNSLMKMFPKSVGSRDILGQGYFQRMCDVGRFSKRVCAIEIS